MSKLTLVSVIMCFSLSLIGQSKSSLTLEEIHLKNAFRSKTVSGLTFLKDGNYSVLEVEGDYKRVVKYDLASKKKLAEFYNPNDEDSINRVNFVGYTLSLDETKLLLATSVEKIYRHSSRENNYVWDIVNKTLTEVSSRGKQQYAKFSPKGDKVAFVRDNNIYIKDLGSGQENAITVDGEKNHIINGVADWVYEEEFVFLDAFQWSPDGKKVAYVKFNEKEVKEYSMPIYGGLYPEDETFKYPKAGEVNSKVSLFVYHLEKGKTVRVNIGQEDDLYVPRIQWTNDSGVLSLQRMNRWQNKLELLMADANTGQTTISLIEENKYYIDVTDNLFFLNNGEQYLWTSEIDGHNHIYLYDFKGNLIRQITKGEWDVTSFYGIDESSNVLYFQSNEISPLERQIYSINIEGEGQKLLTKETGWSRAVFNKNFSYFMNYHSSAIQPTRVSLRTSKGKEKKVLEDNESLIEKLNDYKLATHEFIQVPNGSNELLNGYMIKPTDFDAKKQYPVFMYVYGGPGSQTVMNRWDGNRFLWHSYLTDLGYIVVSVDNRGTGARGEEFKKMTYKELGKYETEDQIDAAKYLGGLAYVDATRIGIFGWSYGGYMSTLCITKGAEYFKAAIAVAPVTNWRFYDSIYTERYMRTPQENPEGYDQNSPINFVEALKGNYLLIHGTADDNVHFHNAVELTSALVKENKQFTNMYYPDKNHGILGGNTRLHLYTMMTNFIKENL